MNVPKEIKDLAGPAPSPSNLFKYTAWSSLNEGIEIGFEQAIDMIVNDLIYLIHSNQKDEDVMSFHEFMAHKKEEKIYNLLIKRYSEYNFDKKLRL